MADTNKRNVDDLITMDEPEIVHKSKRTRQSHPPCMVCKDFCEIGLAVMCNKCEKHAHLTCMSMTQTFYTYFIIEMKKPWICPLCNTKSTDEIQQQSDSITSQLAKMNSENERTKTQIFEHDLKLKSQQEQMEMLVTTMAKNHETSNMNFTHMQRQIVTSEDKIFKELCYIQGINKQDEILMNGVPHHPNEDLKSIVILIARALKVTLSPTQIVKCHRLGNNNIQAEQERIQPILVKFSDKEIRDDINNQYIHNLTAKIYLNTSILDKNSDNRIYLNAHLPQCLVPVYKKAMELRKQGILAAVNARINHVHIKYKQKAYKIHTLNELAVILQS